jgi:hypothetical protein
MPHIAELTQATNAAGGVPTACISELLGARESTEQPAKTIAMSARRAART